MDNKYNYSSENTLLYLFQMIKNAFVRKETGKGLSTNDYTNDEKAAVERWKNYTAPTASQDIDADKTDQTKYATPYAVHRYIGTKLGAALVYKGSCAFADLPALEAENVGHVYNVTDPFVTTANFIEGAGHSYAAGQNVAVAEDSEGVYRYDVLAQPIDLSGYVQAEDMHEITNEEFDALWDSVFTEE